MKVKIREFIVLFIFLAILGCRIEGQNPGEEETEIPIDVPQKDQELLITGFLALGDAENTNRSLLRSSEVISKEIELYSADGTLLASATTDEAGRYIFDENIALDDLPVSLQVIVNEQTLRSVVNGVGENTTHINEITTAITNDFLNSETQTNESLSQITELIMVQQFGINDAGESNIPVNLFFTGNFEDDNNIGQLILNAAETNNIDLETTPETIEPVFANVDFVASLSESLRSLEEPETILEELQIAEETTSLQNSLIEIATASEEEVIQKQFDLVDTTLETQDELQTKIESIQEEIQAVEENTETSQITDSTDVTTTTVETTTTSSSPSTTVPEDVSATPEVEEVPSTTTATLSGDDTSTTTTTTSTTSTTTTTTTTSTTSTTTTTTTTSTTSTTTTTTTTSTTSTTTTTTSTTFTTTTTTTTSTTLAFQSQLTKLQGDTSNTQGYFGNSVSLSGQYAIVGAKQENCSGGCTGQAYIMTIATGSWSQQATLTTSDGAANDYFGKSVSISGDYAIIGADGDDDNGEESGSAYIFARSGNSWSQQAKLTNSNGAAYDYFGNSVSLSGDYAVVGVSGNDDNGTDAGSAYIFVRSGTSWLLQTNLTASDGANNDNFGTSVSLSGDYAITGTPYDDDSGENSGSAYIFVRSGTSWSQQTKLTASDGAANDNFGFTVSTSGDYAIVGAPFDDDNGTDSGAAYVFVRSGESWSQQTKLTASDGAASDNFGRSVSISGDYVLIGANGDDDNGSDSGSVYVFKRSGESWSQYTKLTASDGAASDHYGVSVAIDYPYVVIGAFNSSVNYSGAAYFY